MKSKKMVFFFITFLTLSTFLTFIPNSSGELKLSESKVFNGLYANYTFASGLTYASGFKYAIDSGDMYNVSWWVNGSSSGFWQEDLQTRLTSNAVGSGPNFGNGVSTPVWVFTNITLNDTVSIVVDGAGDHPFNVTDEITFSYPGYGNLHIWVLQDLWYPSSLVWYEKSTGLLLNGTFIWFSGSYIFTLTETNMFSHYQTSSDEIPGYSLVVVLPLTILMTVLVLKKWKKKFTNNK